MDGGVLEVGENVVRAKEVVYPGECFVRVGVESELPVCWVGKAPKILEMCGFHGAGQEGRGWWVSALFWTFL